MAIQQNEYEYPIMPFGNKIKGINMIHSIKWECMIIDECQNYTNIKTKMVQGITSICTYKRILLSGTLLQEVSMHKILGLMLLLNCEKPRNVIDCEKTMKTNFIGLNSYCIIRTKNPQFNNV